MWFCFHEQQVYVASIWQVDNSLFKTSKFFVYLDQTRAVIMLLVLYKLNPFVHFFKYYFVDSAHEGLL